MNGWKHRLRPAYGPGTVSGFGDGEQRQRAVVLAAFSVTRDAMVAALMEAVTEVNPGMDVDRLPDTDVRRFVEERAALAGVKGLDEGETWLRSSGQLLTDKQFVLLQACFRAVNRAYPVDAFGTVLLAGSPRRPLLRCTAPRCQWARTEGVLEHLLLEGVEHGRTHGAGDQ
ncbi:hypothetical protein [Streptomyces smyrnaeus]|uniref:hypothetical protein n=1 Tax=Streptomyces smyrnaeus TaxID=1387713 RepID=UPI0033CA69C1